MRVDAEKQDVFHNGRASRFEIRIGEFLCVLEYQVRGNTIFFTHTGVPSELEGQGLASRLAHAGLEFAREKSYTVVPACEFMEIYLKRHPEYKDLVRH